MRRHKDSPSSSVGTWDDGGGMVTGVVNKLLSLLRPVASLQASLAGCAAMLAAFVALSGYSLVALVLLSRHLTSAPPVQTLPLYFDYTHPVASAVVDLGAQLTPFPRPLPEPLLALKDIYSPWDPKPRLQPQQGQQETQQPLRLQGEVAPPPQGQRERQQQGRTQERLQRRKGEGQREQHPRLPVCSIVDDDEVADELLLLAQQRQQAEQQQQQHSILQAEGAGSGGGPYGGRILYGGQRVRVSVTLRLPAVQHELFQLSGEMLTADGRQLARAVRTHLAPAEPTALRLARHVALAPCFAVGLCSDAATVDFVLFDGYAESERLPLTGFRASLLSRRPDSVVLAPPPVQEAVLKVELQMGLMHRLLYWLRPSLPLTLLLTGLGGLLGLSASGTAMCLLLIAAVLRQLREQLPKRGGRAAVLPHALPVAPPRSRYLGFLGRGGTHAGGGSNGQYQQYTDDAGSSVANGGHHTAPRSHASSGDEPSDVRGVGVGVGGVGVGMGGSVGFAAAAAAAAVAAARGLSGTPSADLLWQEDLAAEEADDGDEQFHEADEAWK